MSVVKDCKKMLEAVKVKFTDPIKLSLLDPEGTGEFLLSIGKHKYKGFHPNSKHAQDLLKQGRKKDALDLLKTAGFKPAGEPSLTSKQVATGKKYLANIKALIKELDKKSK